MDEIQVLIPVAVKSKLTEALKTTLLNQINQNIKSVENDMTQLGTIQTKRQKHFIV